MDDDHRALAAPRSGEVDGLAMLIGQREIREAIADRGAGWERRCCQGIHRTASFPIVEALRRKNAMRGALFRL